MKNDIVHHLPVKKKAHCESRDGAKEDCRFFLREYENKVLVLKSYKKKT